jgi:hypothetical protein
MFGHIQKVALPASTVSKKRKVEDSEEEEDGEDDEGEEEEDDDTEDDLQPFFKDEDEEEDEEDRLERKRLEKKKAKWVDNGKTGLFRVRLIGDPTGGCKPIEIRENILPGGIPLLWGHQTEDGTGMYHMSLGEKLKTYYEQLCTAYNQETDNRSKNTRRPVVYDVIKLNNLNYDFGHSNAIPVEGDPRSVMMELGLLDMTATIQNLKIRDRLKSLVSEKTRLAAEDPLTGLQNRRSFVELVATQKSTGRPLTGSTATNVRGVT